MQWLAKISVRRPVFAWVLMLVVVALGAAGYRGLGLDQFPNVDFPVVVVTTRLDGAAPEEVEADITDKIESAVNTISGIDELRSTSSQASRRSSCSSRWSGTRTVRFRTCATR